MKTTYVTIAALALGSTVSGQACQRNVIIENGQQALEAVTGSGGELPREFFNAIRGKWGRGNGINLYRKPNGAVAFSAQTANTVPDEHFAFFTLDPSINEPCIDVTPFKSLVIVGKFPPGLTMSMTLTQKLANCVTRGIDSSYQSITTFVTPNAKQQVLVLPLNAGSPFSSNINNTGTFDFAHLKDFTFTTFNNVVGTVAGRSTASAAQAAQEVEIYGIELQGNCPDSNISTLPAFAGLSDKTIPIRSGDLGAPNSGSSPSATPTRGTNGNDGNQTPSSAFTTAANVLVVAGSALIAPLLWMLL